MNHGFCRCECGASLAGLRSDAVWASEACKKRHEREQRRDKAGTTHPLQTVREDQATKKHNRDLGGLIRQAIIDQIKTTGECFADDLVDLYPEGEVKECRRLATAQFGSMVATGLIREKERRRSKVAARKAAKSGVYILTRKGREQLVGNSSGRCGDSLPAAVSDETPVADGALTGGSSLVSAPDSSDQSQSGRDRQVRAAGSDEEGARAGVKPARPSESSRRISKPARRSDQPLVGVNAGLPTPQGMEGLEGPQEQAGVHSGKSSAAVSSRSEDAGEVSESASHRAAAEPPCLPGFEESAAARHLKDAA